MVWREPKTHADDCYFCLVTVKEYNMKTKHLLRFPNIHSAMRPILHSDEVYVPNFTKLLDIDEDNVRSSTSSFNYDNDAKEDIAHEVWSADKVSLYSQSELNDLM